MKICVHNDGLGRCAVSGEHCTDGPCDCEDLVEYEPVRRGRWVDNHCTECGKMPMGTEMWDRLDVEPPRFEWFMDYCPCCGAKMDGERE